MLKSATLGKIEENKEGLKFLLIRPLNNYFAVYFSILSSQKTYSALVVIEDTGAVIKIVHAISFLRRTNNTAKKTKFLVAK